tara:strand:+ start:1869 stop:2855 length:987 start_codon:yes stop_codon:yes gene_type:complete
VLDGVHASGLPDFPIAQDALIDWLRARFGVSDVRLDRVSLLPGGAIQNNWRLDLRIDDQTVLLVLRSGPELPLPESRPKAEEFDNLQRAWRAGVPVPQPLWLSDGDLRPAFIVSEFCRGDSARNRLIAGGDNGALLTDLASALARIHTVGATPETAPASPLRRVETLDEWACVLARVPDGIAAGLDWLRANFPSRGAVTLVHRDFRTGNFLVEDGRLVAVLDWEFANWGDPAEDIGWFCAACWRGDAQDREAGGLGARGDFYRAYQDAGGRLPGPEHIRFWEVFAHVRWALIAMQQGERGRAGAYPARELEEAEARVPALARTVAGMI